MNILSLVHKLIAMGTQTKDMEMDTRGKLSINLSWQQLSFVFLCLWLLSLYWLLLEERLLIGIDL